MKSKILTFILGVVLLCLPFHFSYGQGARYTGSYTESAAIQHVGKSNFVIEGSAFTSSSTKYLIVLYSCENVIIRNNKFGPSPVNLAIYLDNCNNITIIDNSFENVQSGMVAHNSRGIKFEYNDLKNVVGPLQGGGKIGNMAIFDKVTGAGNSISYNVCENISGESYPEDIINVNQSHGTLESPIMVKGNWLRGGGPSLSGGGIILGDVGGSYQIAENNIVVDPGQYGISIAGGNNMILRNNKVFSSRKSFNNVGIYAANWYETLGKSYNITVANNAVNYTNKDGVLNNFWFAGNVEPIEGKATNVYDPNLSASILPDKIIGRAGSISTPEVEPTDPVTSLLGITNDPSISIYLDKYNRVCVNSQGPFAPTADILAANESGAVIYSQKLTRFHTVLPYRPTPGKYYILVRNGDKAHLKLLSIL